MKKIILLSALFALGSHAKVNAQFWNITGNIAAPTDYIGTNNPIDLNFYTFGNPRGRITSDGNFDFGTNTFTLGCTISSSLGQGNSMSTSAMCFSAGNANVQNTANYSGAIGMGNTITSSQGVVALGQMNNISMSNQSVLAGEALSLNNGHGCFVAGGHSNADGRYIISLGRHVTTNGNRLHAYGDMISNDLDESLVMGFNNNRTMVLTQRGVSIQVSPMSASTTAPTHNLIVDANPTGGVGSNIAFINLPSATRTWPNVVVDPSTGELYQSPGGSGGGVSTSCFSLDYVTKSDASGNLTCSQIYDDGATVGINTTGPFGYTAGSGVFTAGAPGTQTVRLDVNGLTRSVSFAATSDGKYKTGITTLSNSLENVLKLRGVEYNWKAQQYPSKGFDNLKHSGFVAQELMEVLPNAVIKDQNGDFAVDYNAVIPVLAEAIKEQQKQIDELKSLLQKQSNTTGVPTSTANNDNGAFLAQNVPNPFSAATEISYQLPKGTQRATIGIYDMNGKEIKLYPLASGLAGKLIIQGGDLQPGMYTYTLLVDGKYFDGKRMVITSE